MSTSKSSYHHGDVRDAAIQSGLLMLKVRAVDEIGLREIARSIGVSPTALYRYFPDKAALLDALADAGLELLGAQQVAAQENAGSGVDGFNAIGTAYVEFALGHPSLFRLIFSRIRKSDKAGLRSRALAMSLLQRKAAELSGAADGAESVDILAARAWSLVHGLAVLLLDGQIAPAPRLIASVIDAQAWFPSSASIKHP